MLTEHIIRNAKAKDKSYVMWDDDVRGFGCRIFKGGQKSFVILYRMNGKLKWVTLCRVGEMSLKDARQRAAKELMDIRDGGDGLHAKRDAIKHAPTFADVWTRYETEFAPERIELGRMKRRTLLEYGKIIRRHVLPVLGTSRVSSIARADIERVAKGLTATPMIRNRMLAVMSRLMNLAEVWDMRPQHSNPVRGVVRAPENARDRVLSPSEMKALNGALMKLEANHLFEVKAIYCATLTGLRISECLSLRWDNINLEIGRAVLPETKTGKRVIVLAGPVRDLLADLPRFNGSDFVFTSLYLRRGEAATTYKNVRNVFAKACVMANLHGVHLHDLRRSFLTMLAGQGFGAFAIRDAAGHASIEMANRYVRMGAALTQTAESGATMAAAMLGLDRGVAS